MRVCSLCFEEKPLSEFYKDKRGLDGLTRRCKTCHASKSYESRKKRPDHATPDARYLYSRKRTLVHKMGISVDEYDRMFKEQEGKCAICARPPQSWRNNPNYPPVFEIDHDHWCCSGKTSCGRCVRGLLCGDCNSGLGMFGDSRDSLMAAVRYLNGRPSAMDRDGLPLY